MEQTSAWHVKPVRLDDGVDITYRFDLCSREGTDFRALVATFSGPCPAGSAGSRAAHYMANLAASAIDTWVGVDSMVFDLRGLSYEWGDGMMNLVVKVGREDPDLLVYFVVSNSCRYGLASLLCRRPEDRARLFCDTLEEALDRGLTEYTEAQKSDRG